MLVSLVPGIDDLVVAQTADGIRTEVQLNALAGGLEFDTRMAELRSQAGDRVEPSAEGSAQTACVA